MDHNLTDAQYKLIREFEHDYRARIKTAGYRVKAVIMPAFWSKDELSEPKTETEPCYHVEIAQSELIKLCGETHDASWHATMQHRYPHLREAYLNYLTQVYLTVDHLDRY